MAIYEVAHFDCSRVSGDEGSIRLVELRTVIGRGKCDSGGHRRTLSKFGARRSLGYVVEISSVQPLAALTWPTMHLYCHVLFGAR